MTRRAQEAWDHYTPTRRDIECDGPHELAAECKPRNSGIDGSTLALLRDFERQDMNADELNNPIIGRLESEILILRGALNLSRERAEDAVADLQNQTNRAEAAEAELREHKADLDAAQAKFDADMEQCYQQHLRDEANPPEDTRTPEMKALSERVAEALFPTPPKARKRKNNIPA